MKKIIYLFGGPGAEHAVSIAAAQHTLPSFPEQFSILPVFITKERQWVAGQEFIPGEKAWQESLALRDKKGLPADVVIDHIEVLQPDLFFIGLYGEYGEDGTVQTILETRGLLHTGSDAEASALAINKPKVLQILQDEGINVPDFLAITADSIDNDSISFCDYVGYPVVLLPAEGGSSVDTALIHNQVELAAKLKELRPKYDHLLLSKHLAGREISCGVLVTSDNKLTTLPPTEIKLPPSQPLFDYDAKYTPGKTEEITPAPLPSEIGDEIKNLAYRVHQLVGADGYSRTDFILHNNKPYVLEINTLPGLTATSILPQQALAKGISFPELLTLICSNVDQTQAEYLTASLD